MTSVLATTDDSRQPHAKYFRVGLVVFLTMTAAITFWLLVRRISGVLLTLTELQIATGGIATVLIDLVWRAARSRIANGAPTYVERWLPTLVVVAALLTLASPAGPWGIWVAVAFVATVVEFAWHRIVEPFGVHGRETDVAVTDGEGLSEEGLSEEGLSEENSDPFSDEGDELDESEALSDEVQQKWVRSLTDDGTEQVWGVMRVPFERDQRIAIVHAAFCPVLENRPDVEAYAVDGPDASVRATAIHRHGVRLEVRLASPAAQGEVVTIEIIAASSPEDFPK